MENRKIVQTGVGELDSKFSGGGFPAGTLCMVASDIESPVKPFFLQIYQNTQPKSYFYSPIQPMSKIEQMLNDLNMNTKFAENLYSFEDGDSAKDLLEHIEAVDFETEEIFIIHAVSEISFDEVDVKEFYSKLAETAVEQEIVFMFNTVRATDGSLSKAGRVGGHMADTMLSFDYTRSENDIAQSLTIDKMSTGQWIQDTYRGKRVMEVTDGTRRVEVSTGGRI